MVWWQAFPMESLHNKRHSQRPYHWKYNRHRLYKRGDLDGNGTEEWGYVTQWPISMWMCYHAFTNINGEWQHIIEPTPIWLPHLDPQDSIYYTIKKEDILQPSEKTEFIKVKFIDIRNNGEDFLLIDTLIRVNPQLFK